MIDFKTLKKFPKNVGDLGSQFLPKALKSCPKSNKSPNLVTMFRASNPGTEKVFMSVRLFREQKIRSPLNKNQFYQNSIRLFQALYDCFEETIHELRHQVSLLLSSLAIICPAYFNQCDQIWQKFHTLE